MEECTIWLHLNFINSGFLCNMIGVYFIFVYQYGTDKITKAFIVNANIVPLLTTGHNKTVIN